MANEMEKNVVGDASIVVNEDNKGRDEIRHGASKGHCKSKDMWGSLYKRISEVETSLEMLCDQFEDAHQQVGVIASDNDVMQDNVKGAINKLGGVLMQDGHTIAYKSRKLNEVEKLYTMQEKEMAAIIHWLRVWRHYLLGAKFVIKTDNIATSYFKYKRS
ncbi:unnamed protein product [Lactuca virosa]|uniref:Reverse transcriptase RNase H-like domain-containing protein n=1 Tax=Lactuca virosa TaxID=75947 RepID=A0AAU9MX60_9ASTR|nr:unnamed protein product [Lactuca virosa]